MRGGLRIMAQGTHCKRYQLLRRGPEERTVIEHRDTTHSARPTPSLGILRRECSVIDYLHKTR